MEININDPAFIRYSAIVLVLLFLLYQITRFFDRRRIASEVEEMGGNLVKISRMWFPYAMMSERPMADDSLFASRRRVREKGRVYVVEYYDSKGVLFKSCCKTKSFGVVWMR